jgi:hypothetical protein
MNTNRVEIRKANALKLAEGYTATKRTMEIFSITVSYCLWLYNFIGLSRVFVHSAQINWFDYVAAVPCVFMGVLFADFMSGLAHWALDTWGDSATPVFGAFIRSFREHHVDQTSITRHDFIETNGDNALPIVPVMLGMLMWPAVAGASYWRNPLFQVFLLSATFFVAFTNQAHKMSHSVKQPAPVRWMMDRGLIMSQKHHRIHHSGDFSGYYCITTGWLNAPLDGIGFWRGCEVLITACTGALPRADDKKVLVE